MYKIIQVYRSASCVYVLGVYKAMLCVYRIVYIYIDIHYVYIRISIHLHAYIPTYIIQHIVCSSWFLSWF